MASRRPLAQISGVVTEISSSDQLSDNLVMQSRTLVLDSPTTADDKYCIFFTDIAVTIKKLVIVLVGSSTPSVTSDIRYGTDISAAGTALITTPSAVTSVSTGTVTTSFDNSTPAANSYVWYKCTAQSGTVTKIIVTIFYK